MECRAVNRSRGATFFPEVKPAEPLATIRAGIERFSSELHTGQIEIMADKEFASAAEDKAKDADPLFVKREPAVEIAPGLTFAYTYDNVPVLVTG